MALTPEELAIQAAFQNPDLVEHIRKKAMWAGSTSRALGSLQGAVLSPDGQMRVVPIANSHTPAFLKMLDELIVNASDHWKERSLIKGGGQHSKVTKIAITFEPLKGIFTIKNNGPGIPVIPHDQVSQKHGRVVYLPEVAFCVPLAGSNMEKDDTNVKGGINGVGAKIANIHSVQFRFTTVYYASDGRKIFYTQKTENRMTDIQPPHIEDIKKWTGAWGEKPVEPYTEVKLEPAYYDLGYPGVQGPNGSNQFTAEWAQNYTEILMILRLRCCHLAAYAGPKVVVTLNEEVITTTSAAALAGLHLTKYFSEAAPEPTVVAESILTESQMKPKEQPFKEHPWAVAAIISPHIRKFDQVSIINGVVTSSGSHLTYIKELLKAETLKRLQRELKNKDLKKTTAEISKNMLLVIVGALPRANWTGQRKDELSVSRDLLKNYTFTQKWMKETSEGLCQAIIDGSLKKKPKKKTEKPEKYTKAKNVDKKPPRCKLMVAEGDSAITLLRAGMTLGLPGTPSFDDYGIYSLGGVPMNTMKQVEERSTANGSIIVGTKSFDNNKVLQNLFSVLGVEPGAKYETESEIAQLHYAGVIICVDGDVDGAGKIAGLVLATFYKLWPNLLVRGYLQWFMTPVIRIYPASAWSEKERARVGAVAEFYHEQEFHAWEREREEKEQAGEAQPKVMVRYYKGLGTHEPLERPQMFANFEQRLYTFAVDSDAPNLFEVHYGKETAPRKAELSKPLRNMPKALIEFMDKNRVVPCGVQLNYFTKAYKIDALERQLLNAFDGMTVGRRKAFDGARERFGDKRGECQTFQLAGYVADRKQYHHGGSSMENALIYSCQNFEGARVVPYLIGSGEFGTRLSGGQDAASARYTRISLNTPVVKWLMPREDDTLLPYEFVDGQRAEPKSYVPIICCSVLDHTKGVTEGWNFNSFARKPSQVIAITAAYCYGDPIVTNCVEAMQNLHNADMAAAFPKFHQELTTKFPLDIALQGLKGEIRHSEKGQAYHVGVYTLDERETSKRGAVINISELPIRKWSNSIPALAAAKTKEGEPSPKAKLIQDVTDYSGKKINITVTLKPGALETIRGSKCKEGMDHIETFLELYTSLRSDLNVIRPVREGHGGVMMMGEDYHSLVLYHLPARKRYYALRFERRRILLELEIRMVKEIIRYIEQADAIQISKCENEKDACQALRTHKFPLIYLTGIRNPGFTPIGEISNFIIESTQDYDIAEDEEAETEEERKQPKGPTYNYILNLHERDLIQSALEKRRKKLGELEKKLVTVMAVLAEKPFAASSVWLEELGHLEKALIDGGYYE